MGTVIKDELGRTFRKLRLSVTSACNYRCYYCNPSDTKISSKPHSENHILTPEKLAYYAISVHQASPLASVRITGGEPTLYPHLKELVSLLKGGGIPKVGITTNGSVLYKLIKQLKNAGLDSVNISLDALDTGIFRSMTGNGRLEDVLRSADTCMAESVPLKINCTVIRGRNDSQILPLFRYCKERNISIRFIELMEMGHLKNSPNDLLYLEEEILREISSVYSLSVIPRKPGITAREFITNDGYVFGIIANSSHPFCGDCDRLRLDSTGNLYGCLSVSEGENVIPKAGSPEEISELLQRVLSVKMKDRFTGSTASMKSIGG